MRTGSGLIFTIVKREFLENVISFKFIACLLVAVVLAGFSTFIQAGHYLDRLEDYDKGTALAREALTKVPAYSFLRVDVYKKPSPLSILVPGVETRTGNRATITHREIPASLQGSRVNNEFASIITFFDLTSVIVGVFSVLAILLAYGSISGEKESGVLSLALSGSVPRSRFLAGKFLGGILSLAAAVLLSFLVAALVLFFTMGVGLGNGFLASLLLIYLFSLLYLSAVLLFGIFVSSLTKSSFQSLVVILTFHLVAVFVLPLVINSAADGAADRRAVVYERNIGALLRDKSEALAKARGAIQIKRSWAFLSADPRTESVILGRVNPPETIAYYESLFGRTEKIKEDYAVKAHELRLQDQLAQARIDRLRHKILALLPASCFSRAVELEAGTGRDALTGFFRRLTLYWRQYIRYLDDKKAFSLAYFYPYSRELPPSEKALVDVLDRVWAEKKSSPWASPASREIGKLNARYEKEIEPLSLDDMPAFVFEKDGFGRRAGTWLPYVLVLVVENVLLFLLGYVAFARTDPRTVQ